MSQFTITDLQAIAREVIGDPSIALKPQDLASSVPGWDSLNHTLIVMEINSRLGIDLQANRAARARDFDHLVRMVRHETRRGGTSAA